MLARHFAAIGASLEVTPGEWRGTPTVDVRDERFVLGFGGDGDEALAVVIQAAPAERHLLLLVRSGVLKSKFLCGHDERHWFVAAVPEDAQGVADVATGKLALQPELVRRATRRAQP